MFTIEQIEIAHSKVKSGADFPKYIMEIKQMGVIKFETWVTDSHTKYYGRNEFETVSKQKYNSISISENSDKDRFVHYLKIHQNGDSDYFTFCQHCAETGIEKWIVNLEEMTCTYYDKDNNEILIKSVPSA